VTGMVREKMTQDGSGNNGLLRFARTTRGNAGVEFALLLPLLGLLLFGGIEIGRALHDFHVVNESVRDAARYLSRVDVNCPSAGTGVGTPANSTDVDRAKALAITGSIDTLSPAPGLLSGWDYPSDASTVTVRFDCIDNPLVGGVRELEGLYVFDNFVPHVVLTADVPFTFLFGEMVTSDPTITITLSHNVAVIGL